MRLVLSFPGVLMKFMTSLSYPQYQEVRNLKLSDILMYVYTYFEPSINFLKIGCKGKPGVIAGCQNTEISKVC